MLTHYAIGRPFAVFSKPGSDTLTGVFQTNDTDSEFDYKRPGFVFHPFTGRRILFLDRSKCDIVLANHSPRVEKHLNIMCSDTADPTAFTDLVNHAVKEIKSGTFQKVVLARRETLSVKIDICNTFENLIDQYPSAFRYCFFSPEAGLWMGATPEKLLAVDGGFFKTMALAGTKKVDQDDISWGAKEKNEQQFVTDYIVSELQSVTEKITVSPTRSYRAGNLVHLLTDISGTIKEGVEEVIAKLHPTPAVCGMPKAKALDFIQRYEGFNREFYSGFLGELNADFSRGSSATDLYVNLRCMKVEPEKVHFYVGCGITIESDPDSEFLETVNKAMTMKQILS